MRNDYQRVTATDGAEKRWLANGDPYKLEAGKSEIFPGWIARLCKAHYTCRDGDGEEYSTVELETVEGVMLHDQSARKFVDPETGEEYDSLDALLDAVRERYTDKPERPTLPSREVLEGKSYVELLKLCGVYDVDVASDTKKAGVIEALLASEED